MNIIEIFLKMTKLKKKNYTNIRNKDMSDEDKEIKNIYKLLLIKSINYLC